MTFVPKQFPHPETKKPSLVFSILVWEWTASGWRLAINLPIQYQPVDPIAIATAVPAIIAQAQQYLKPPPPYVYVQLSMVGADGAWHPIFGGGNWKTV